MPPTKVDYSLYLVTDSTPAILGDRDLISVVTAAIEGGVTIVQYRDKTSDTAELIHVAKKLHTVTKRHGVPLLINDRVDVALAVGAEGVHVGQDDMDLQTARELLGADAIIGVSASSSQEAIEAAKGGADYLGIGTVFATPTKEDSKSIIGPGGVRDILAAISDFDKSISTVCIGGINSRNLQRVMYQAHTPVKSLDGVAIVSAMMAASDPKAAAQSLRELISTPPPFSSFRLVSSGPSPISPSALLKKIPQLHHRLATTKPINHNMTNLVVQNFSANVAIALGSSPIMSLNADEASDLASLAPCSLVINMGTVTPDTLSAYTTALHAYNSRGQPVLFDPVGGGATTARRSAIKHLLKEGYFTVIKGNQSEIQAVLGTTNLQQQRGVDSSAGESQSDADKAAMVRQLAQRERNVVLMTGATDFLSDGQTTLGVRNGHELLGEITGSGCALGSVVASFLAVEREEPLLAALAGLLVYEIAAERAAVRLDVQGPGTFVPALIDEIYKMRVAAVASEGKAASWLEEVKDVQVF